MDGILTTLTKHIDELEEQQRQIRLAKQVISKQQGELVELDDKLFDLEQQLQKLSEENMKLRKTIGTLRGQEEIYTFANSKLWETNKKQLALLGYWKSRSEEYQRSFNKCNADLDFVKRDNDRLRLKLTQYYERYGELK